MFQILKSILVLGVSSNQSSTEHPMYIFNTFKKIKEKTGRLLISLCVHYLDTLVYYVMLLYYHVLMLLFIFIGY